MLWKTAKPGSMAWHFSGNLLPRRGKTIGRRLPPQGGRAATGRVGAVMDDKASVDGE